MGCYNESAQSNSGKYITIGKLTRITGTAFIGALVAAIFAVVLVLIVRNLSGHPPPRENISVLLAGLMVVGIVGFITGAVVAGFRFRLFYGAVTGVFCGTLAMFPIAIISIFQGAFFNWYVLNSLMVITVTFCSVELAAGWICGFLSPRSAKDNDGVLSEKPPPPDQFNIN